MRTSAHTPGPQDPISTTLYIAADLQGLWRTLYTAADLQGSEGACTPQELRDLGDISRECERQHAAMLAALRGMVDMFERHIESREGPDDAALRWDAARAAIALATGEGP